MEQQFDAFTVRRFELMLEMAANKLQREINSIKETLCSQSGEINSLKNQLSRMQFQAHDEQQTLAARYESAKQKNNMPVDNKPETQHKEAQSKIPLNPVRPRYDDYKAEDVSIDKFFYFGRK